MSAIELSNQGSWIVRDSRYILPLHSLGQPHLTVLFCLLWCVRSPVATELPSNTGSSTPKQGWVHGLEQVDSSPLQSRAAESLSEEKDEAAAWRAEAVRREAAHAEEKVRKEEAEQEALQVAEKAAESARIAQLRSYKEQAKRLEESRRSPQNTAGRSTSAVSPPPTARTPSNSSAAAARYAAVEPSLSATRPRNRWESVHSASRVEEATAGGASSARKEEAVPVSARKAARAAQAEVGTRRSSWREVALRREAAMLGTNRRRRRRTDESRQLCVMAFARAFFVFTSVHVQYLRQRCL